MRNMPWSRGESAWIFELGVESREVHELFGTGLEDNDDDDGDERQKV